jgi:hypothetical protein
MAYMAAEYPKRSGHSLKPMLCQVVDGAGQAAGLQKNLYSA